MTDKAYRNGYCAQCHTVLAIRDVDGKLNSFKSSRREAYLHFQDGHSIKIPVCVDCLENPNFENVMTALKHTGSQAGVNIKRKDLPKRIIADSVKGQQKGLKNGN